MTALGLGHSSAPPSTNAVCRGINSALLATGVKDALRISHSLLFIIKAPAWQQGPCPPAFPPTCHLSLFS